MSDQTPPPWRVVSTDSLALFGDSSRETAPESNEMDDLFAEDEAPGANDAGAMNDPFGDLFDDVEEPTSNVDETSGFIQVARDKRHDAEVYVEDDGTPQPSTEVVQEPLASRGELPKLLAPEAREARRDPVGKSTVVKEPTNQDRGASRLADARRHRETAREVASTLSESEIAENVYLIDSARAVLDVVAKDLNLRGEFDKYVLTRDRVVDSAQRMEFRKKVEPLLIGSAIGGRSASDLDRIFEMAYDEYIGISVVGDLWRDGDVDEIMINAWNNIYVERFGRIEQTTKRFRDQEHANSVARSLSQRISDRSVSPTNALPTAQLPRARVQFVWGSLAASGLAVTIRKFKDLLGMEALLARNSLSEQMRSFLEVAVESRATILVCGGTGTGKTTMINALSEYIPDSERVVTIEDSFELELSNRHVVPLQAKTRSSADDEVIYTQEDLMVASLRMRPDRIIVGEIREPSAAAVMLQAANTGHDGTMTTLHASSVNVALNNRMVSLLVRSGTGFADEVARLEVAQAIDLVVHIERHRLSGQRYIAEIACVDPLFVTHSAISPRTLFSGSMTIGHDGAAVEAEFIHPGRVPLGTTLAAKLLESGRDVSAWVES